MQVFQEIHVQAKHIQSQLTRTSPSSNNNLSNLTVNNKTVTNFNKNTLEYTLPNVSNETTSLLVGAVVEDTNKAQIKSGTGAG